MKALFLIIILMLSSCYAFGQNESAVKSGISEKLLFENEQISDLQKKEFIELLKTLPTKGEFYTEESNKKAASYLRVLFALTEKDIEADIYPYLAISRGICDQKEYRDYAVKQFAEIKHPLMKLFWAAMLFNEKTTSKEIILFLKQALESPTQEKQLAEILGPNFKEFQKRVKEVPIQ